MYACNSEICCESRAPHRFAKCDDRRNPHSYCEVCIRQHLRETIFEKGSPWMRCLGDGCVAFYRKVDYERILEPDALAMRERLETRASLKNVKGMTACPACDFAAFVDPGVDVFVCGNAKCKKDFCIKCQNTPHPGISCVQAGKRKADKAAKEVKENPSKLRDDLRRKVENYVSEALIRKCNDCGAAFVKDQGCNEMKCICGNTVCYQCKAQHIQMDHWFNGRCTHFEPTEVREEAERKKAEKEAIAKVLRENPGSGLTEKDLMMKEFCEKVKQDAKKKMEYDRKMMRGEGWNPSMGIEGADEDLEAELQLQMAGVNFGPPTFPIPSERGRGRGRGGGQPTAPAGRGTGRGGDGSAGGNALADMMRERQQRFRTQNASHNTDTANPPTNAQTTAAGSTGRGQGGATATQQNLTARWQRTGPPAGLNDPYGTFFNQERAMMMAQQQQMNPWRMGPQGGMMMDPRFAGPGMDMDGMEEMRYQQFLHNRRQRRFGGGGYGPGWY